MSSKTLDGCSNGDFQLGFGTNMSFEPADEILSPADCRKRTAQHDKGPARNEETFVQPETPKKHKGAHPTHVSLHVNPTLKQSILFYVYRILVKK